MKEKSCIKTILSLAKECQLYMVISVICAISSVIAGIVPYFAVSQIIVLFLSGKQNIKEILYWSEICLIGYILQIVFHAISTLISHHCTYRILKNMRNKIVYKLMHAPLGIVINQRLGKIKNIIVDEVEKIETPLAHMIPEGISNLLLPIGVLIYLFRINRYMAIASLITIPLTAIPYGFVFKSYKKKYDDYMISSNHMNSTVVEYMEGIEVIKAFNQSGSSYEKFINAVTDFKDYTLDWFKDTWKYTSAGIAILPSTLLGTLPVGMYLYISDKLTTAEFAICLILSLGIITPLTIFADFINEVQVIGYAIKSTNEFLELDELEAPVKNVSLSNCDIEFKDVVFSYDKNNENTVIKNINLFIKQGEFTALVGASGSGKSTLARLIARFWDVDKGDITIGGINIKEIPFNQLMDTVSFVTQDNFLFNCSIIENIRLGKPSASDKEVINAAKMACCNDFIEKLDNGYDTKVGDAGGKLSGGERQRIAIARAILKNAPIVILDEATAFTDPENEEKIQKSISILTKGKTLLVIAHRLSTIKSANQIIVMNKGDVVQTGTQEELLKNCSLYSDMWNAHICAKQWVPGKSKYKGEVIC